MKALFIDATPTLADIFERLHHTHEPELAINRQLDVTPQQIPALLEGFDIVLIDHTPIPTDVAKQCRDLRHVVFLGTGARSYMSPEELADIGITVHTIKGYGDTAVAECAFALMWAGAKHLAHMDRAMRAGNWLCPETMQLTGKTLGLVGFGGIAAEMARLATGIGMNVLAWNRSPKTHPGVTFVELDALLAQSHVVSLHLLLTDETRGMISADRIAQMRDGAMLVNTARAAIVDEDAMIAALKSGKLGHAGLDVFLTEPMPAQHPLFELDNVTLSAHSAFRTPEASNNLVNAALKLCHHIWQTRPSKSR